MKIALFCFTVARDINGYVNKVCKYRRKMHVISNTSSSSSSCSIIFILIIITMMKMMMIILLLTWLENDGNLRLSLGLHLVIRFISILINVMKCPC